MARECMLANWIAAALRFVTMSLCLTSLLAPGYSEDLENLLFFHPQQGRFRRNIIASVEKYGSPRIVERNGGLRIQLQFLEDVQTLYGIAREGENEELAGTLIYTRTGQTLEILHIVVKDEYTMRGAQVDLGLTFMMIEELCRIGRMIQGIHFVRLAYERGGVILKQVSQQQA